MCGLHGDSGAKSIMDRFPDALIELLAADDAAFTDVDDAYDLQRARPGGELSRRVYP